MSYTGELQRNNPFSFQAPAIFSPWVDRLLIELRRRLRAKSQNVTSVRRIVKLLDSHLNAVARFALENQDLRSAMVELLALDDRKRALLNAETPEQVRASIPDHDLRFSKGFRAQHLIDTPPGHFDVGAFEQCAVFALWKFAASKEAYERDGETQAAIGLSMEGMTLAHLAFSMDASEIELAREIQNLTQTTGQAVNETIAEKKQQSRAIRGPAAKAGNDALWGTYRRRAFELASSRPFEYYSDAAKFVQSELQTELTRYAELRTISGWIKEKGWRPTKAAPQ